MMFRDRLHAGQVLAENLKDELEGVFAEELVVVSIARGGVEVGVSVSNFFGCERDVLVVKKLRLGGEQELAYGAIGNGESSLYLNERLVKELKVDKKIIDEEIFGRLDEVCRLEELFRNKSQKVELKDKYVVVVDDGVATGATAIVALREVWKMDPRRVILGVPVIAKDSLKKMEEEVDSVVFVQAPEDFFTVGQWYDEFDQLEDKNVLELMEIRN